MNHTVIEFNNVGKQYILGTIGTGTLSQDLNRWWANIRGKEDPFLKIGETNDRTQKGESRFVWALRNINFKVEQGDVVGIVGKNGAGKSTLLKTLNGDYQPNEGKYLLDGEEKHFKSPHEALMAGISVILTPAVSMMLAARAPTKANLVAMAVLSDLGRKPMMISVRTGG